MCLNLIKRMHEDPESVDLDQLSHYIGTIVKAENVCSISVGIIHVQGPIGYLHSLLLIEKEL